MSSQECTINIRVHPRASRDEVVGVYDKAVKVRLKAPPVDGAANDALISFLAKRLSLPRKNIAVRSGHTSRSKTVSVAGVSQREALDRLLID